MKLPNPFKTRESHTHTPVKPKNTSSHRSFIFSLVILAVFIITFLSSFFYLSILPRRSPEQSRRGEGGPPPASLHVPEPGEMPAEKDTASPLSAQEVFPSSKNKVRTFNINIAENKLPVRRIIVYENDVVRINLTVSDNPYTLSFPELNIAGTARKEKNVRLEFQAVTPGSFTFICGECQNPSNGELIVVPGFSPGKTDNYK